MQAILLDAQQASVLAHSYESIPVRDQAGKLLGHMMPTGATYSQEHVVASGSSDSNSEKNHWIECWAEWYAETEEEV